MNETIVPEKKIFNGKMIKLMSKVLFQDLNLLHQKTPKPNRYQFVIVRAYVCYTSSQVEHKKVRHDSFMMSFYTILHTLFVQYASIYLFHLLTYTTIYTDGIHIEYIVNQRLRTHDGYFPNSYGQYHIWDIFGLGLKSKVFCRKNN